MIVHLDGVSRKVLLRAMENGIMPRLAASIEEGKRVLLPMVSGIPASTPAFQAALFYGARGDCPGYQWHDKRRGRNVRMDDAAEVLRLEQGLRKRGRGLLHGGSTYFTIMGGGATEPTFCMSRLAYGFPFGGHDDPEKNGWDHLASVLAHTVPFVRGAAKMAHTAVAGSWDSLLWSLQKGRLKNEPRYVLNRLFLAELAEEVTTYLTLLDISRGVPAVYSVYAGYDEVAHRRGPFSAEAISELAFADRSIGLIEDAIRARPEFRYELYVLSDHGQQETRPVEEILGGVTLADWILAADGAGAVDPLRLKRISEDRVRWERLHALPFGAHLCNSRMRHGGGDEGKPPLIVSDAGDLAHVYLNDSKEALDLEAWRQRWPGQLEAVLRCPASGIVVVRGGRSGFAFYEGRRFDLSEPHSLRGILPHDPERLRFLLQEMISMQSAGDLVVFGAGVKGGDVAYAWEFGSHGGVGEGDLETFLIHPSQVEASSLLRKGPAELHQFFRRRFLTRSAHEERRP